MSGVTYLKDVAPILEKRCGGCHTRGASTIALDTYEDARAASRAMRESILERRMPPWPAAPGYGDYKNDRSLTPVEIELLTAWTDGRTPLGAIDTAPTPAHAHEEFETSANGGDAVSVALPAGHPDRGQRETLELALPIDRARSIAGWEFAPGSSVALIQRADFLLDGVRLGSWTPSQGAFVFPEGVSVEARAGSRVTVEMQYAKSDATAIEPGTLTVRFGERGTQPSYLQLSCGAHTLPSDARAFAITPSAPFAGDAVEVVARYLDGRIEPLSVVPRYEPAYPLTYEFREPVRLPRGTIIDVSGSSSGCGAGLDVIYASRAR